MKYPWKTRIAPVLLAILLLATGAAWLSHGGRAKDSASGLAVQAVDRQDITVTIEASGTVEPVDLVEVKSKASGTITSMPVSVGSKVKANELLVKIDDRDVRNQYDQTVAALHAAQSKVTVSLAQKKRSEALFSQGIITAPENEAAQLDYASSEAALVSARTNLDLAKQKLDDATVRAPIAGTVLSQAVTAGQVTTSATNSVNGGTSLLTMADLHQIRMRALVAETDVGQVQPGQRATVTVDAFPNRTFQGTVEKVEPQAVVEQSVTNFPVLISLPNDQELLLPGMNGDVSLMVDRRTNVLAVPVDAVRNLREAQVIAPTLGMNPDSVAAAVSRQRAALFAGMRDSLRARGGAADTLGGGRRGGGMGFGGGGSDSARAARRRAWMARNGGAGFGGGGGPGGGFSGGGGSGAGGGSGGRGGANRAQVAFVKTAKGIEPRLVRLGLSDFDYSEVLSGLQPGDQVVLLGVAQANATRAQQQASVRQRVGSMQGGLGGGGGAGGGGARSGGGRSGGGS